MRGAVVDGSFRGLRAGGSGGRLAVAAHIGVHKVGCRTVLDTCTRGQ